MDKPTYPLLREMVMLRKEWRAKVESDLLGAFGEYMSGKIADHLGLHNAWTRETARLAKRVNGYFTTKNITFKDKKKAFDEIIENINPGPKINYARHHVAHYYPRLLNKVMDIDFDEDAELAEFIKKYIEVPENE